MERHLLRRTCWHPVVGAAVHRLAMVHAMNDLIARLRAYDPCIGEEALMHEAANALEAAQAEIEQLQSDLAGFAVANTEQADQLEQAQAEIEKLRNTDLSEPAKLIDSDGNER